jgi:hypothetical protein
MELLCTTTLEDKWKIEVLIHFDVWFIYDVRIVVHIVVDSSCCHSFIKAE